MEPQAAANRNAGKSTEWDVRRARALFWVATVSVFLTVGLSATTGTRRERISSRRSSRGEPLVRQDSTQYGARQLSARIGKAKHKSRQNVILDIF
jgi:hypothetical protein